MVNACNHKDICASLPEHFEGLRLLYQIFLSLPITTASVERGFSKLALVKNKLRTTMRQSRLEALMLAAVESDLVTSLNDDEVVAKFAAMGTRKILLG